MTRYAIFKDGEKISRGFFTRSSAEYTALAEGYVVHEAADFDNVSRDVLADGYEIRELTDD